MKKLKMSNRSKVALDKSIEHWEDVKENNSPIGPNSCDLCTLYRHEENTRISCKSCPVYKKSGATGCRYTPYYPYSVYYGKSEYTRKKLAQQEIDFLKSCYY